MKTLCTIFLLITGVSIAQPPPSYPQTISFQAMITDTLGNSFEDGLYNFTFSITSPAQGGAELFWAESKQVNVVDGIVNTILGSDTPINLLPFRDDLYLEVALDNNLISVNPLTSVPFAFTSHLALSATHADTAHFTQHAHHAETSGFAHQSQHAEHADTAYFVLNTPMSDSSHYANQAGNAEYADTSHYAHQADNAMHANEADSSDYSN